MVVKVPTALPNFWIEVHGTNNPFTALGVLNVMGEALDNPIMAASFVLEEFCNGDFDLLKTLADKADEETSFWGQILGELSND